MPGKAAGRHRWLLSMAGGKFHRGVGLGSGPEWPWSSRIHVQWTHDVTVAHPAVAPFPHSPSEPAESQFPPEKDPQVLIRGFPWPSEEARQQVAWEHCDKNGLGLAPLKPAICNQPLGQGEPTGSPHTGPSGIPWWVEKGVNC